MDEDLDEAVLEQERIHVNSEQALSRRFNRNPNLQNVLQENSARLGRHVECPEEHIPGIARFYRSPPMRTSPSNYSICNRMIEYISNICKIFWKS